MQYRNAKFNENGTVDVDIKHPIHGWITFTADADDVSEFGRLMHEKVKGKAAAHVPKPKPPHVPQSAPDRDAALRALIVGDTAAAQAAMDKME